MMISSVQFDTLGYVRTYCILLRHVIAIEIKVMRFSWSIFVSLEYECMENLVDFYNQQQQQQATQLQLRFRYTLDICSGAM